MADLNVVVKRYLELREMKAQISADSKKKIAEIEAGLEKIEKFFLIKMEESGLEALPTELGTPYKQNRVSVTVADWTLFLDWVKENDKWDMLTRGASKDAVKLFKEEAEDIPPGLNWREETVVNVRRS